MPLAKSHLINAVTEKSGFTRNKSTETVETILEQIKSTYEYGEDVLISSFGIFCVKEKQERKGRNPTTGEGKVLMARKVVTFTLHTGF